MLTASPHRFAHIARWSLPRLVPVFLVATAVVLTHRAVRFHLASTTLPTSVLGTAVAFYIGFKNNQAYDRFWEARSAWGSIVNTCRTFAVAVLDHVRAPAGADQAPGALAAVHRELVLRQLAWVNALRLALRRERTWEAVLGPFLTTEELAEAVRQPNVPTYLLRVQSRRIEELVEQGLVAGTARHLDLRASVRALYDHQGVCERIKNTPLVPHYTAASTLLVWIYIVLLPFSLLDVFAGEGVWVVVPIATLIGWIYDTMDRIGRHTENPFDGLPTDVPMRALCRTIEIDLRAMLGERDLPPPVAPTDYVLD